ncbi:helix-turn-helix transcriptional regulator [Streptomyces sp. RerS4]|uniref:helix-turn-helix transcriptional regulator n=1 Tax=Streptomyces sp. RerS4 TaxID=2942449 RepID=UPI00201CA274|nr:helix-turn-helix transcriptional regulator [Streptomyces sp. RerS4]UQW99894.1 helix-turn-helix transcriptional regulator [Streptomyces sp. RerS4]
MPPRDGGPRVAPDVIWGWRELHRTDGRIKVTQLAAQGLVSVRTLERRFREQIGRSSAEVARILRFTNALRLQSRGLPLATVARLAGHHDQAHFNDVVKETTGLTPIGLARERLIQWTAEPPPAQGASAAVR